MSDMTAYAHALDAFLHSPTFVNVVRDDLSQMPPTPRVLELLGNGSFTVYSNRHDAQQHADAVLLEIPFGTIDEVRGRLRAAFEALS